MLHSRRIIVPALVLVGAIALAVMRPWSSRSDSTSDASRPTQGAYVTAARRDFSVVVTAKAVVAAVDSVALNVRGSDVAWTVADGSRVRAGQVLGTSRASSNVAGLRRQLAAQVRARNTQLALDALDRKDADRRVAAARRDVAAATTDADSQAARDRLEEAVTARTRLILTQEQQDSDKRSAIADLEVQLRRAPRNRALVAPTAGVLRHDASTATILPDGYVVRAGLSPALAYKARRLAGGRPLGAVVTLPAGPVAFPCPGVRLDLASAPKQPPAGAPATADGSSGGAGGDGTSGGASAQITAECAVPDRFPLVPGLEGTMALTLWKRSKALVIDSAAVRDYDAMTGRGTVTSLSPDGKLQEKSISLGPGDGVSVVVVRGLSEGERLLTPIPQGPSQ
jgi:hypothetical protein